MKKNVNGVELHYEIEGDGPWMTLSHSLACDSFMWEPQVKALSSRYTVLRVDTRGHGKSGAPPGPYSLDMLARDFRELLDVLGIQKTHFAGLSMGGMIGQTFALNYPGVLQSLILADTTSQRAPNAAQVWGDRIRQAQANGMAPLVEPTLARWFTEPYRLAQPQIMKRFGDQIAATPVAGYAGCCAAIAEIDLTGRLHEILCPALVIVGDQDLGTTPDQARTIQSNLPGSELVILESAAHISNVEQAPAFNRAMLDFLKRVA